MQSIIAPAKTAWRPKWLAILMTLVLALSMVPIAKSQAYAAAAGASYKAGTYTVPVTFKVDNRTASGGSLGADLSTGLGTLVVGEDGSLALTVSGMSTGSKFWCTSMGTAPADVSVTSTATATKTVNSTDYTVIDSFTASISSISTEYNFTGGKMLNFGGNEFDKPYCMTVDFSGVPAREGAAKTAQVPGDVSLTYNGAEQVAYASCDGYTVTGGTATDAGDYTATLTLNEGYKWADGSTGAISKSYKVAQAALTATYAGEQIAASDAPKCEVAVTGFVGSDNADSLKAAGYKAPTVEAPSSIAAGGSYILTPAGGNATKNYKFTYVSGTLSVDADSKAGMKAGTYTVTARLYVPSEVSPMSKNMFLTCDPNATNGLNATPPLASASSNATLVVGGDGSLTLTVPLNSNALSLYGTGTVSNATIVSHEEGAKTYTNPNSKKDSTKDGLYTSITLKLDSAQASYKLSDFGIWMAPMGGDISSMAKVTPYALLNVDFSSVPGNTVTPVTPTNPEDKADGTGNDDGTGNGNGSNNTTTTATASGKLAAGTYTVSSNIYMEKATTGLPMGRAYLTSGEFPPNQAVTSNSTLTVDDTGRATVQVPLDIQVMSVKSLPGLNIVASQTDDDGYLKNVTVDLGVLENVSSTVTRNCTANVSLSDMVVNMAGLDRDQSWAATLEVDMSGVPTAVGGFAQTGDIDYSKAVNAGIAAIIVAFGVACFARRRMSDNA